MRKSGEHQSAFPTFELCPNSIAPPIPEKAALRGEQRK